jgi:hypothetical protein
VTLRYLLERRPSTEKSTIGEVSVEGKPRWFVCEDIIREPASRPITDDPVTAKANLSAWVASWKVAGSTCIPAGSYRVIITDSQRFKKPLPLLLDVPGFTGIRIHPGNVAGDTEGCILPGMTEAGGGVYQSKPAFAVWFDEIQTALLVGRQVWIDIHNPEVA